MASFVLGICHSEALNVHCCDDSGVFRILPV